MLPEESRQLCHLFAKVLDYPGESLAEAATQCALSLEKAVPESAELMGKFAGFVGEGPKRSALMVKLQEAYLAHQFSGGTEIPDHLCVILRFLGVAQDAEFVIPLLRECLLPVLGKVEKSLPGNGYGYAPAVSSLKLFLQQVQRRLMKAGGTTHG